MICEKIEDIDKGKVEKEKEESVECPMDPRFPQQNKAVYCQVMFSDFHRCAYYLGPKSKHCRMFKKCYEVWCPRDWIRSWQDKLKNGTYPVDITKELGK
ncbi:hypothetical protein O3M35_008218 [Rhynocoris fuscipes]|uniref:Uncharacterized protein n=1 Tax=Rhynocoris fuscipes TaxID=488301 RepID=A0AAW1D5K8_9HEMI